MANITRTEKDCKCIKIDGQLEAVKWMLKPRKYKPSPGYLALGDWTTNPFTWLACAESLDGLLPDDDVLLSTDTRYWSIHDVQRYFYLDLHCEKVLFTIQFPNLRMSSPLGSYLWKSNTALKIPSKAYKKELYSSLETTLKKLEAKEAQMSRLIISDQLVNIDQLDCCRRKTFFRILLNLLSFQDALQLVSFENLCCKRLEGVRLIQQLACFNAHSLKYLFLWQFVLPNENPLLINYSYINEKGSSWQGNHGVCIYGAKTNMTTDEEKSRIAKLLHDLEVPEIKLTERCSDLVKGFHKKFYKEVEEEEAQNDTMEELGDNPFCVDSELLEENDRRLREVISECKRAKRECKDMQMQLMMTDPKRPWRTNSNKEKLLRIDNEIKQHLDRASNMITPMATEVMQELVKNCRDDNISSSPVTGDRLRQSVDSAKKNLTNFQYRKWENTTATSILPEAHAIKPTGVAQSPQ